MIIHNHIDYFTGPTEVTVVDKPTPTGPLAVKDPILEMVNILTYVLDKANCRYNSGQVYQFETSSRSTYVCG